MGDTQTAAVEWDGNEQSQRFSWEVATDMLALGRFCLS